MISPERSAMFGAQLAERRRRGRPRSTQTKVRRTVDIPTPVFDALCARASKERIPLHRLMNEALARCVGGQFHP